VDPGAHRREVRLAGGGGVQIGREAQRLGGLGEHEHERVPDLLDERPVVLVEQSPDERVEPVEDLGGHLVAVHLGE
jgi:hypothetical protein